MLSETVGLIWISTGALKTRENILRWEWIQRDMDIEDRLRLWKKERSSRTRADSIAETWRKMEKRSDISTKEKLERLLSLTRTEKGRRAETARPEPQPKPPYQVFENHFRLQTKYGRIALSSGLAISGEVLALLSRNPAFSEQDLSSALFLDLETTGLSGGAGVVPFLVGLGYYREGQFHLLQFFLGELAEEENMILELGRFFARTDFRSLVTFNGKAFDLPLQGGVSARRAAASRLSFLGPQPLEP